MTWLCKKESSLFHSDILILKPLTFQICCVIPLARLFSYEHQRKHCPLFSYITKKKKVAQAPVGSVRSSLLSSVSKILAMMGRYSIFADQFSHGWLYAGRAATHSPWYAWWGEEVDPVCGQWQCLQALLSRNLKQRAKQLLLLSISWNMEHKLTNSINGRKKNVLFLPLKSMKLEGPPKSDFHY